MSQKNNQTIIDSPFNKKFVNRAKYLIGQGELPITDKLILEMYISFWFGIHDAIRKVSGDDMAVCKQIIEMGSKETDPFKGETPPKDSTEYNKYQLGQAMAKCNGGLAFSVIGRMDKGLSCLCSAYYYFSTISLTNADKLLLNLVNQYNKGPKSRSLASEKKWSLARQYFLEEIPKHKTLKKARKAAAERAGIYVEERQLALKLPNPNLKKKVS